MAIGALIQACGFVFVILATKRWFGAFSKADIVLFWRKVLPLFTIRIEVIHTRE